MKVRVKYYSATLDDLRVTDVQYWDILFYNITTVNLFHLQIHLC